MIILLIALVVIYIFLEELSRGLKAEDVLKRPQQKRTETKGRY